MFRGDEMLQVNSFKDTKPEYYLLMNKDKIMFSFKRETFENKSILSIDTDSINSFPLGFENLDELISKRTIIRNRDTVGSYLETIGLVSNFDMVLASYGVSLTDTLWVKSIDDTTTWGVVNPFSKNFNFDISWFLDTRTRLQQGRPEYSTDGNYPKCWKSDDRGGYLLIKCGTSRYYNSGLEPFGEFYTCQLEKALGMNFVEYALDVVDYAKFNTVYKQGLFIKEVCDWDLKQTERVVSVCRSFCDENTWLVPVKNLGIYTYEQLLQEYPEKSVAQQLVLDALTLNGDRHFGNIGVLVDADTQKVKGIAPCYDNNLALLPYFDDRCPESLEDYVCSLGAKTGQSFKSIAELAFSYFPELKQDVKNLKGFKFAKNGRYNFKQSRLDLLSSVIDRQIGYLTN